MASTALAERAAGAAQQEAGQTESNLELLKRSHVGIAKALPANTLPAERFIRAMQTEMLRLPQLAACTPESLMGAVLEMAQLGLEPGPLGHASVLPFNNRKKSPGGQWYSELEAKLIIEYRGFIDLGYRSGLLKAVTLTEVCAKDKYRRWADEDGEHLIWEESEEEDRGPVVRYLGIFKLTTGGSVIQVLSKAQVEGYRKRAQSQMTGTGAERHGSETPLGAWASDYDAMALKTVVRRAENKLPKSAEMSRAFAADDRVIRNEKAVRGEVSADDNVIEVEGWDEPTDSAAAGSASGAAQGDEGSPSPETPAPAAADPKATPDELNTFLAAYQKAGREPAKMSNFVTSAIGRQVRGTNTLTSDEVKKATAALTPPGESAPPAEENEVESSPSGGPPSADDDSLVLGPDEKEELADHLTEHGLTERDVQQRYVIEALGGEMPEFLTRGHVKQIKAALKADEERERKEAAQIPPDAPFA